MQDAGQKYTERELAALTRRFKAVYRQAQDEIIQKMNAHLRAFKAKDKAKRALLEAGKITKNEYDNWLMGQVFAGKQWRDKLDSVATSLLYANQQANTMIEGGKRAVFGENATFQAYKLENGMGMDLSFSVYDSATVTRLIKKQPELLPRKVVNGVKDKAWNRTKIAHCITQGIIQGEAIEQIAKRMARDTASQNQSAMIRYARTAMTGAQNAGRMEMLHEAQDMGINVKKKWLATLDSRTRDSHAYLDGQVQDVDKPFHSLLGEIMYPGDPSAHPGDVWNCFIGDTKIATDSEIEKSFKHEYSGDLITIKTAGGVEFTCTPNHPILTPVGWIGANRLNKGDNILVTDGRKLKGMRINPNIDHVFPSMNAFHKFFQIMPSERAFGLSVNFHGDRATANVEVISKKRLLWENGNTSGGKVLNKFFFKHSDSLVFGKCHFVPCFRRIYITANSCKSR